MQCKRILLVVDSPEGLCRGVLHKVAQLAVPFDAEVEVFDSAFDPAVVEYRKVHNAIERRRGDLELTVDALRAQKVRAYATVRWAFPPREAILQQMRDSKPDLLVVRSWKRSRLARALFTYSDYKLIETASCPILLVKNDAPYENARVIAAVDPMHLHDKPAALDERITEIGAAVAGALALPLHVYHALSPVPSDQARAQARVRLLAKSVHVPNERIHVATGDPAVLLPGLVSGNSADLLVMGAVSRSWVAKALIGYTAERVLDRTDCDLLIVKLPG